MRRLFVLAMVLVFVGQTQAMPDGIDRRGDDGCLCHGGSDDTTTIILEGLPNEYNSSQQYNITLSIESPVERNNPQGGFRIIISQGEIIADGWQFKDGGYTHTEEITDRRQWDAVWVAPSEDDLLATFIVHGNAVNGDGTVSNDEWNSRSVAVPGPNYDGDVSAPVINSGPSNSQIAVASLAVLILLSLTVIAVRD